jgi:hypothetical protein
MTVIEDGYRQLEVSIYLKIFPAMISKIFRDIR